MSLPVLAAKALGANALAPTKTEKTDSFGGLNDHLHVVDILIGCYTIIVGGEPRAMFSETVESFATSTNAALCNLLLKFVDADITEQKRFESAITKTTWVPSLEYMNASAKLLDALQEQRTWPAASEAFREEVTYALSFWIKQLYALRKGNSAPPQEQLKEQQQQSTSLQSKLVYRGVFLPIVLRPLCDAVVRDSKEGFDSAFGLGKMESVVQRMLQKKLS